MAKSPYKALQSPEAEQALRQMKEEEIIDYISSDILPSLNRLTDRLEAYVNTPITPALPQREE